jgi:K(+)-stimulated pyrophosphate-energized sodium pump
MYIGLLVCVVGLIFGLKVYNKIKNIPVAEEMSSVSDIIWETCKTYLLQQGKFLALIWALVGLCIIYYFGALRSLGIGAVITILIASVIGILGSYGVAWFGIRVKHSSQFTFRLRFPEGSPLESLTIPMTSGMSVGLLLVSVELFFIDLYPGFSAALAGWPLFHRFCHR